MTINAAATYLTSTCPETGAWSVERLRKVFTRSRLSVGRVLVATGEPESDALVQNVADGSVTYYGRILRSPYDGTTMVVGSGA